jgi:methionyl aminopeptidase
MIEKMRNAGNVLVELMNELLTNKEIIKEGRTGLEIDKYCHDFIVSKGARPAALNYYGFPNSICVSVNDIVCHGIPNNNKFQKGDIISIDIALEFEEFYSDSCITVYIEPLNQREEILIKTAYETMWKTIEIIKPGVTIGDLGFSMESYAKSFGFNVIKDFCGHGIGKKMHENPQIPFFGKKNSGEVLRSGMFITIEPMVTMGRDKIQILNDEWSAQMKDKEKTAQFEHTIFVTENGFEVITYNDFDKLNNKPKIK